MVAVCSKSRVSQKLYTGFFSDDKSENRLINASNSTTVVTHQYDYMGRRFESVVPSAVSAETNTYVYDGWAMIREESATTTNTYVYGLDLSGSTQGAGTIGGILTADLNGITAFYCYDANGNVADLVGTNGASVAHYEYGPFGQTTVQTGTQSTNNPFRFSTKYLDDDDELYYYGLRYYNPQLGRWVNRDPLGDWAFLKRHMKGRTISEQKALVADSLKPSYVLLAGDALNNVDVLGLATYNCAFAYLSGGVFGFGGGWLRGQCTSQCNPCQGETCNVDVFLFGLTAGVVPVGATVFNVVLTTPYNANGCEFLEGGSTLACLSVAIGVGYSACNLEIGQTEALGNVGEQFGIDLPSADAFIGWSIVSDVEPYTCSQ